MKITREMVRGTAMGIRAIDNVIRYAENDALIATASAQKEALVRFHDEAADDEKLCYFDLSSGSFWFIVGNDRNFS